MRADTMTREPKSDRGFVIIVVLILIIALALVALILLQRVRDEARISGSQRDSLAAVYIAEAGIQHALAKLRDDSAWRGTMDTLGRALDEPFNQGRYIVRVWDKETDPAMDLATYPEGTVRIRSLGIGLSGTHREVEVIASPKAVARALMGFAAFACGKLKLDDGGGPDALKGGDCYAGGPLELAGTVTDGDLWAVKDLTIEDGGHVDGSAFANGHIDPKGDLPIQIEGEAVAGEYVKDPSKVAGECTDGVAVVPAYCVQDSPEFPEHVETVGLLTTRDVDGIIADAGAALHTHHGGWDITSDVTLEGVHHVDGGKLKAQSANITYRGHVVVIVDGGAMDFKKTRISLSPDPGTSPEDSSLLLVTIDGKITFGSETLADFNGVVQAGVIDTWAAGPHLPPGGHIKITTGAKVDLAGTMVALADLDADGTLNIDRVEGSPPAFQTEKGIAILSWFEVPPGQAEP